MAVCDIHGATCISDAIITFTFQFVVTLTFGSISFSPQTAKTEKVTFLDLQDEKREKKNWVSSHLPTSAASVCRGHDSDHT